MPAGVAVDVADGVATIVFLDPALRGPGLGRLLAAAEGPHEVEKLTWPQVSYRAPVDVARAAGLIDVPKKKAATAKAAGQ